LRRAHGVAPVLRAISICRLAMKERAMKFPEILALVDRVRPEHEENEVAHELLAQSSTKISFTPSFRAFFRAAQLLAWRYGVNVTTSQP